MVITQQFRTVPQRNVLLRPLATGPGDDGFGQARPAPPDGLGQRHARRFQRLHRRVTIPYWMLVVTLASMTAGGVTAVRSFVAEPASAARAPIAQLAGVQPNEGLMAGSGPGGSASSAPASSDPTIAQLQDAIAAVTMNLERTERDNASLRDQERQQSQDLSTAVNGTVLNEQQRAAEVQGTEANGQQQTQQLQDQYNALSQGVANQANDLQQKAAAAAQLADKLRAALGM